VYSIVRGVAFFSKKMDFTDDQIINLINEYEKYPVLWDPNDKFYKLNNKKKMHVMR